MKYIVTPQVDKTGNGNGKEKPCKIEYHTLCALCSEDPRFCGQNDLV